MTIHIQPITQLCYTTATHKREGDREGGREESSNLTAGNINKQIHVADNTSLHLVAYDVTDYTYSMYELLSGVLKYYINLNLLF